jgi:type I restriction enzyme R subunit
MDLPSVHKVVFVVDRKDLDYQTMQEFNAFKKDSVSATEDTTLLVKQLSDDTKLVLTTIQKLNNAIRKTHFEKKITQLRDKKIVFIFDECHRTQFGETHERIKEYFHKAQLFGFTGTPIFAENAAKNEYGKRTTKDLFGECLHKYVITDAIRDQNVLRFGIEYIGKYRQKGNTFIDIDVEDIDRPEVLNDEKRLAKIVDYIIAYHDQKTFNKEFSALFATSSINNLIKYYELFKNTICALLPSLLLVPMKTMKMLRIFYRKRNWLWQQTRKQRINRNTPATSWTNSSVTTIKCTARLFLPKTASNFKTILKTSAND